VDEFRSFVRPVRNTQLSSFCTELTGIRQVDVDAAPPFTRVFDAFTDWLRRHELCVPTDDDADDIRVDGTRSTWTFMTDG
jgi:inhibitor of KinA sporulation pathway (predicted exonuclease)